MIVGYTWPKPCHDLGCLCKQKLFGPWQTEWRNKLPVKPQVPCHHFSYAQEVSFWLNYGLKTKRLTLYSQKRFFQPESWSGHLVRSCLLTLNWRARSHLIRGRTAHEQINQLLSMSVQTTHWAIWASALKHFASTLEHDELHLNKGCTLKVTSTEMKESTSVDWDSAHFCVGWS